MQHISIRMKPQNTIFPSIIWYVGSNVPETSSSLRGIVHAHHITSMWHDYYMNQVRQDFPRNHSIPAIDSLHVPSHSVSGTTALPACRRLCASTSNSVVPTYFSLKEQAIAKTMCNTSGIFFHRQHYMSVRQQQIEPFLKAHRSSWWSHN